MYPIRNAFGLILTAIVALSLVRPLEAGIVYSGTSSDGAVSASAQFSISTDSSGNHLLKIVLTNTSAPIATANNAQVLTGVTWGFNPNLTGTLSLFPNSSSNPTLTDPGLSSDMTKDHVWVTVSSSQGQTKYAVNDNIALGGTWTNKTNDSAFSTANLGDYGYATTGANNLFAAGTIVGSAPGSANYGLVSDATYLTNPVTLANGTGPQSLPLVQNSITIQFKYTSLANDYSNFNELLINESHFLIGTSGTNFAGTLEQGPSGEPLAVPEPASLSVWGIGLALAGLTVSRRRSSRS